MSIWMLQVVECDVHDQLTFSHRLHQVLYPGHIDDAARDRGECVEVMNHCIHALNRRLGVGIREIAAQESSHEQGQRARGEEGGQVFDLSCSHFVHNGLSRLHVFFERRPSNESDYVLLHVLDVHAGRVEKGLKHVISEVLFFRGQNCQSWWVQHVLHATEHAEEQVARHSLTQVVHAPIEQHDLKCVEPVPDRGLDVGGVIDHKGLLEILGKQRHTRKHLLHILVHSFRCQATVLESRELRGAADLKQGV